MTSDGIVEQASVYDALRRVNDPEVGENIVELGLIYGIDLVPGEISVHMTMTSPACPMGELLLDEVHAELVHAFPGCAVYIELVWEPPWTPERMSVEAKTRLGWK